MGKIKVTKIDIKRKLGTAKKKLFPIVWGCTGEMPMRQFRHIINSMWMLLVGFKNSFNNGLTKSIQFL